MEGQAQGLSWADDELPWDKHPTDSTQSTALQEQDATPDTRSTTMGPSSGDIHSTALPKPDVPPEPESTTNKRVTLQVRDKRYENLNRNVLKNSGWFRELLSPGWAQEDGSYFVDVDPMIFQHIIAFLVRNIFPLCLTANHEYDHSLYERIWRKAVMLRIPHLAAWISAREYTKAYVLHKTESWKTRQRFCYHCPADNPDHTKAADCKRDRACKSLLGPEGWQGQHKESEALGTLTTTMKIVKIRRFLQTRGRCEDLE